ncbi:MAG: bifunctional folylpolyglutamate synthase/dihydrofolate synthase [Hyphomonadaceae bacterium]|nr:bifunctional folylpolyglutamate synthase/dihydrofolate synthase [Hyphomonadaceae bacterium]
MTAVTDAALQRLTELFGPEFGHGKPFDLTKLHQVLAALGSPHEHVPPVIHVAGTNGKGSTIAFMRAIAQSAGLRVHAFTKPHLFQLRERFVVAGEVVSEGRLISVVERIAAISRDITQFDAQVAAALTLFDETHADLILLETGMGGRHDSTNVVPRPAASVITPIGLDHQDALGETLAEIAAHKAGILKRSSPGFVARQHPEAMAVIEAEAARVGAPLFRCGAEWDAYESRGRLVVQSETRLLDLPLPALRGRHQIDNAGLACATLLGPQRFTFADDAFAAGVANAQLPARLQPLTRGALSAQIRARGGQVLVDVAHNAEAAAAIVDALGAWSGDTIFVVGIRQRKDAQRFIKTISPAATSLIAVPLADHHTAPADLAQIAHAAGLKAGSAPSLAAAIQNAAQSPAPRVVICGSFLLAAEALGLEGA